LLLPNYAEIEPLFPSISALSHHHPATEPNQRIREAEKNCQPGWLSPLYHTPEPYAPCLVCFAKILWILQQTEGCFSPISSGKIRVEFSGKKIYAHYNPLL